MLIPRYAMKDIPPQVAQSVTETSPHDLLPTVATCRFMLKGSSADEALAIGLEPSIETFVACLNRLLAANLMVLGGRFGIPASYDRHSFEHMYMTVGGRGEKLASGRISLGGAGYNTYTYTDQEAQLVTSYVAGVAPIDEAKRILLTAKSYLDAGFLPAALLHLVVASEIVVSRYVRTALLSSGASRGKLESVDRDLTFSVTLNVLLFSLAPIDMKPDRQLIGKIDEARRARNSFMHEGVFSSDRTSVHKYFEAAVELHSYVQDLRKQQGFA